MKKVLWFSYIFILFLNTNCGSQKKDDNKNKKNEKTQKETVDREEEDIPGKRPIEELFLDKNSVVFESISSGMEMPEDVENLKIINENMAQLPKDIYNFQNLKQLYIPYNRLNTLPDTFFVNFPDLEVLDISYNRFSKLPESIFKLENLRYLNIAGNNIRELPEQLTELKNLQILNIGENPFQNLPEQLFSLQYLKRLFIENVKVKEFPSDFSKLEGLEWLSLSNATIDTFPPVLVELPNLTYLNISKNKLDSIPSQIEVLEKLENLDISNNPLEEIPSEIFTKLKLKALNIAGTKLTEIPKEIAEAQELIWFNMASLNIEQLPKGLKECENLSTLLLGHHKKLDVEASLDILAKIENLEKLTWANISGKKYQKVEIPANFKNLNNVRTLDLRGNLLKDVNQAIEVLVHLDHLEALNLSNCGIRSFSEEWKRLSKLKHLGLDIKKIPNRELEKLPELLPDIEVTDGSDFFDYRHYSE